MKNLCKFNILKINVEIGIENSLRMQSILHVLMFIHIFVLIKIFKEFINARGENQGFKTDA